MKLFLCLSLMLFISTSFARTVPDKMSKASQKCQTCHSKTSPAVVSQWASSKHYGANVGCFECHQANPGDKDQFIHYGKRISIIVSPKDCARCHSAEVKEFSDSHHAMAGKILGSLDNILAEVVEGNKGFKTPGFPHGNSAAAVSGCWQCHGSKVKVLKDGKLDPATWPNTGIGRLNPDGSKGSCSACHSRHKFDIAQARAPENCGKCHMGPDHPQKEIYEESKHGIAFKANRHKMKLDNSRWVAGVDYNAAPTCATCHMSAAGELGVTHDVGKRISWNNRPPVSIRPEISDKKLGLPGANLPWTKRRKDMQTVCTSCHSQDHTNNFYVQYDALVNLYNEKFAKPGSMLYKASLPLLRPAKFSNEIDFIWFEIWHHEGRRARHGASMMGPDYTHWHGTYEVAKHFYSKFIPKLQKLAKENKNSKDPKKVKAAKELDAKIKAVLKTENHKWYNKK